jgi:hypothetical protein
MGGMGWVSEIKRILVVVCGNLLREGMEKGRHRYTENHLFSFLPFPSLFPTCILMMNHANHNMQCLR